MTNVNTDGLPPEMQARIAQIIEGAKQSALAPAPAAPARPSPVPAQPQDPVKQPVRQLSLMDHTIALRQEVQQMRAEMYTMRQETTAAAKVVEAVGNAVGELYQMFQGQTTVTNYGPEYEEALQAHHQQQPIAEDY